MRELKKYFKCNVQKLIKWSLNKPISWGLKMNKLTNTKLALFLLIGLSVGTPISAMRGGDPAVHAAVFSNENNTTANNNKQPTNNEQVSTNTVNDNDETDTSAGEVDQNLNDNLGTSNTTANKTFERKIANRIASGFGYLGSKFSWSGRQAQNDNTKKPKIVRVTTSRSNTINSEFSDLALSMLDLALSMLDLSWTHLMTGDLLMK